MTTQLQSLGRNSTGGPDRRIDPPSKLRTLVFLAWVAGLLVWGRPAAWGATDSVFHNLAEITNPQIDATTIVNDGTINAVNTTFFGNSLFQTINTLNLTNAISGRLLGDFGFRLEFVTNTSRLFASSIVNLGVISGDSILLSATNLVNSGELRGGELIQLQGNTVNLTRALLSSSGVSATTFASTGARFINVSNGVVTYQNPSAVSDLYWGAGTGNVMTVFTGSPFPLNLVTLNQPTNGFRPPRVRSPTHEVELAATFGTSFGTRTLSGTNYAPFVRTSQSGTNVEVQVVLVQTNSANTNLSVDVRFIDTFGGSSLFFGDTPIVRFSSFGSDITTGALYTNNLFFLDYISTRTNAVLSDNLLAGSSRPAAYEMSRDPSYDFYFTSDFFASTTNDDIANVVFYQNGFTSATITNNFYAAYSAAVGTATAVPGSVGYIPHLDDPTNSPGRIEINANNLDMSSARIRADNLVSIRATNLISSAATLIDAPFIQLSIANTNTTLTLTNFATTQVARANGTVSFYSTVWTNALTNTVPELSYRYHVLLVDASQLSGLTPVTLQEFLARGTNVIINNTLNIGRLIQVDSPALTFSTSSQLTLSPLVSTNLLSTNFPNLNYFTNLGTITVPYQCAIGSDRPAALSNFVNRGTLVANSIAIRTVDYENSGTNSTRSILSVTNAGGGPISILASSAKFEGGASGGLLSAGGSILLAGNDLKVRNHQFITGGTLVMSPTNSLTDTGASGTNRINVALGFALTVKPASGDLLGTTIYTTAPFNREVPHLWAGANRGPVPAGYTNNAAVGRLLLDTGNNPISLNLLSFAGTGTNNALYVDYLELSGTITNDLATHLFIETNMTLYFANANVPVQSLDGQLGGRLRWVKDYAGLNTGVDVRLADGRTVRINVAKLNSQILDSDADGVVNRSDLSPFDGIVINSRVGLTNVPPLTASVTWEAAAQTVYQVEVSTNLLSGTWQFLASVTNTALTNRVINFPDVVPSGNPERYYRVLYQP